MKYDYVIIGAGLTGTSIARELSKYKLNILILDKEKDVAQIQSHHNSSIIHAGNDPLSNTLKAKLNVLGNKMYEELEKDLDIKLLKCGAFTVAHNKSQEKKLLTLLDRAKINGVPSAYIISGDKARELEPNLSKNVTMALVTPSTKIVDPYQVSKAFLENAVSNGVKSLFNTEITNISYKNSIYTLTKKDGESIKSKGVINASGIYADDIAKFVEDKPRFKVKPRLGEYLVLSPIVKDFITRVIYPIPNRHGKGVLLVPQTDGRILIGPTNKRVNKRNDFKKSDSAIIKIKKSAKKMANNIPYGYVIDSLVGIRSTIDNYDFYIKESDTHDNFIHMAGIDSPGLAASPAIGRYVADLLNEKYNFETNTTFKKNTKKSYL